MQLVETDSDLQHCDVSEIEILVNVIKITGICKTVIWQKSDKT
jgi:hypothetical protein